MKEIIGQYKFYIILALTSIVLATVIVSATIGRDWLQNAFSKAGIGWYDSKGVYQAYDDREVYGAVVLGAVQKFPDKCVITTSLKKSFTVAQYQAAKENAGNELVDMNDAFSDWYVNPDGIFYSWLEYDDESGEPTIHFEQKVYTNMIPFDFTKPTSTPEEPRDEVDLSKSKSIRELYVEQKPIHIVEGDKTGADWKTKLTVYPVYDDGTRGPALDYDQSGDKGYTIDYTPDVKISEDDTLSEQKKLTVTYKPPGADGSCNQYVDVTIWKPLTIVASDDTLIAGHPVKISTNYSEAAEVKFSVDASNAVLWSNWNPDSYSKPTFNSETAYTLEFSIADNQDKAVTVTAYRELTGETVSIKVQFKQFYGVYSNITANEDPTSEKAADKVDVQSKIATNDVLQFTVNSAADLYACKKGVKDVDESKRYNTINKVNLFGEKGAPNTSDAANLSVYPIRCAREVEPTKFYVRALAEGYTGVIARDKISGFTVNFMGKSDTLIGGGAVKDTPNGYDGWIYPVLDFNFESSFSHNSNFVAVNGGTNYTYTTPFDSTFSIKTDKGTITLANKTAESEVSDKSQDDVDNKTQITWESAKYWGSNAGLTLYDHFYGVGNEARWARYFENFSKRGISSDYVTRDSNSDRIIAGANEIKNVTLADSNLDSKNGDDRMYHKYAFSMKPQGASEIQVTYNNFGHRKQVCRIHTWYPLSAATCDPADGADTTATANSALVQASTTDNKYTDAGSRTTITMDESTWDESGKATSIKIKQIVGHAVRIDLNQIYKDSDKVRKNYNFSSTIQVKDNADDTWRTLDNKDSVTINNDNTTITAIMTEQGDYFNNKSRDSVYVTTKVNTNHSVYIKVKRPITGEIIVIEIEFKAIGFGLYNQYNENDKREDGGSMFLGNSELKYAKLVNDTTNRMANGDIILAKAGVKDGSATYNYADSTDATLLKLLNYEIGEMTVNGQNGATYALLDCNKLDPSGNTVRFRLYDNDSKSSYPFAKYSMNYNVELAIPVVDRYNQTYNGVTFSGLTVSDKHTSYRFDNAITQTGNYVDIELANNLQNKPVTLWNYAANPEDVYSGELHKNILWNTSQVVPQTVKDCLFYVNTIYKMKLVRGNGYTCSDTSEITADNGGSLRGKTVVGTDGTYVRATVIAKYAQFADRTQTLVFDSWELSSPKPTIPKNDPVTPPGGTPDPGRDEGGTPGVISGTDGATVQGHAIKVTEAHGYADIDFSFTGGDNFDNNYFQYTYDREKCYLTSKRNDCSTKIQVNLTRFRTGEQTSCMTTFYPYEVHLYNGTTGKDYNAGTNLFATGDKQLPYLYVGVLNNYRTYLKNQDNVGVQYQLYVNNTETSTTDTLLTKANRSSDGLVYFQTWNNDSYQAPISYAFFVTLKDEYAYTANMRTDGHTGSKDGATFSGIQFSGGDLKATSNTDHEFYTYRFDNLINGIMQGETRPFHRTKGGVGTFPERTGSVVLALKGLSITDWAKKEGIIAKFYTDEARPSVLVNQLYKFSMLKGYAYEGLVVSDRPARESRANMIHVGLTTCDSCSIKFEGTGAKAKLSDVKINCKFPKENTNSWTLDDDYSTDHNKHAGYSKSSWDSFVKEWNTGNAPDFADYNVVSAHQPGVIYYYEKMSNNITEEFTGAQTRETSYTVIPKETYNVNEFFSDKASDNGGKPVSLTIKYPRFDDRTKTVSFDVKTIGTAEFRPESEKTKPDPDDPSKTILRNYVGRPLYIDLKTISEPDLTNSLVTVTYNTGTGEEINVSMGHPTTSNGKNEWFTDESPFYIEEVDSSQGTDDWWTTSFAITTTENVDTMDVAVTFNGVKCKITEDDSTTADITTTNTGNYFSYSVNAYNASTSVDLAWNQEDVSNDGNSTGDSIGFRGDWSKTDRVELIYKPGDRARKSGLKEFNGQLAGTDETSFKPHTLTETNTGIGAPSSMNSVESKIKRENVGSWVKPSSEPNDDVKLVLQSCGTKGYKIISSKLSAIYAKVKPEDPDALEKMNGDLASPDVTFWHTAYYFNPGGSTRFTKDNKEQADFDKTVQVLKVAEKYTLGHTKNTGKEVSTHYAFRWRLVNGVSATKTAQIETLTAHAQALDNTGAVVGEDTTNPWHFNNWDSAFATGKLLSPIYANSNSNTLYVQYPKFANRTGAITYKIEGASFVPFNATLRIGEGHCAVVDLSKADKEAKNNVHFTLDGTTTAKDLSFDTHLVKSIVATVSGGSDYKSSATDFASMLDGLNSHSKTKSWGIGAFYYKDGKLYFTGRKGGGYKQVNITITSTDGKVINLVFNNMELQSATGIVLKDNGDNGGNYVINQAESINRGDTVFYTLKSNIQDLFNASYRVSISDTFIEMLNTDKYTITTGYRDVGAFSGKLDDFKKPQYIDLMGVPEGKRKDWEDYVGKLNSLEGEDSAGFNVGKTAYHVLGQTGNNWKAEQKVLDFTNPTTGWKIDTSKNKTTVLIQRTLADSTFTEGAGTTTNAYVSKELKDLNALIVEIPDTSYYPNNERAQFYFNIKDYPLAEELGDKGFIAQCDSLYDDNNLSATYYSDFDNRSTKDSSKYQSKAGKKTIQIANNLFLQSRKHDALAVTAGGDKLYDSTRSRALNVVQEAAHDYNGMNKADYYNLKDTVPDNVTIEKEKHFHFNSYNQKIGLYNSSESYPTKCLKGASAILMSKGMFNMYTTRYNNSVLISQPNMETSVNALDFLNTSGLISAKESAYTAFSATQLIQNAKAGGKGKVQSTNKWNNHGITLSDVLKTYDGTHTKTATEESFTTTIKTNGGVLDPEKTGKVSLTKLTDDTLDEEISTDYIMYDMTLKKTEFGSKQVAVFQTTKTGVGFKLTLNGTITGSSTYTSTASAKTGDSYRVASGKDYSNANAYPNNMPAAKEYNYCINARNFGDTENVDKKDPSKSRNAAWVTSGNDKDANGDKITANCRITFAEITEKATAFMPYTVASSDKAYNNNLTIWGTDGSNAGTCCMLDIDGLKDSLPKKYKNKTIRYIDTYIDVCYNNNGFRQVRYPVRLVLN